jgi:SAM-dependent methyltransferase
MAKIDPGITSPQVKFSKPFLLEVLSCPKCQGEFSLHHDQLICQGCGKVYDIQHGTPIFTRPPSELRPSEKIDRGPHIGTPWRQSNWRFLDRQVFAFDQDALILDVGAGRGDFADVLSGRNYIALDVYPYPEVDLVCDLTHTNPLRSNTFDAILLMNVLEHVYDTHAMLGQLASLLKPGGILIVAIPFLVKIHQAPVDFVRYTHYALERLGQPHGLEVLELEGFYDPVSVLTEGIGNLRWGVLPTISGLRHYIGRLLGWSLNLHATLLTRMFGKGNAAAPDIVRSQAPTGYQVVYRLNDDVDTK